jgi:hypothetical protein
LILLAISNFNKRKHKMSYRLHIAIASLSLIFLSGCFDSNKGTDSTTVIDTKKVSQQAPISSEPAVEEVSQQAATSSETSAAVIEEEVVVPATAAGTEAAEEIETKDVAPVATDMNLSLAPEGEDNTSTQLLGLNEEDNTTTQLLSLNEEDNTTTDLKVNILAASEDNSTIPVG